MPRNYVRRKIKSYRPQDLADAIQKIKDGELTQYSAAKLFKIPLTTLHDNLNKKGGNSHAGRPIVIPLEDERKLAEAIVVMEKWGFGLSRFDIMDIVADYIRVNNIKTPFRNNIPGPDWFINFRKRHRLSVKKAQPVEYVRRQMTDPFVIAEYFDLLDRTLKDLNLLEKPYAIWNLDETSVSLDPSRTKVVGQINKPCARTTYGSGKENITVLTGANASGKKLPPLIVFKGKFVWDQWMADFDPVKYDFELSYSASKKGWMEADIFYNYVDKILIPNLGEERPVLVIYDGHSTHVDVRVIQLAVQNQVTIIKLPPHTSHLLQPMDISVFKSFKTLWDAKLVDWQRRNVGTKMPKKVFAQTLADTWQQTSPDVVKTGFRKAGIYPFNAHVVPVDKYDPDAYKRYQTMLEKRLAHAQLNPKQPKRLQNMCIDFFNNLQTTNNTHKIFENNNVTFLSQVSKSDPDMLSFIAKHPSEIPICLRNSNSKPIQNNTLQSPGRVIITSNILIKKAPEPPLKSSPQKFCTFEQLVLKKIQQDKKDVNTSTKKKRITKGAEVITATMGKKILEEIDKSKYRKTLQKTSAKKQKSIKINKKLSLVQKPEEKPGTSSLKYKSKIKRQPSYDSSTSISDIMSEHSDSDIIDIALEEELSEEDAKCSLMVIGSKRSKRVKTSENLKNKKLLTNQNLNILSTKGIGKKSKGKENKISLIDKEVNKSDAEGKAGKSKKTYVKSNNVDEIEVFIEEKNSANEMESKKQIDKKRNEVTRKSKGDHEVDVDFLHLMPGQSSNVQDYSEQMLISLENKYTVPEKQEDTTMKEIYKLRESVLVRYYIRNKWKYYIGFIEDIIKGEKTQYCVNFLKATKIQQQLCFVIPKRRDVDKIPETLIVKKINLKKNTESEKGYYLCNNDDTVYFE